MRILIFGINYAPELTGIGKYTGEMGAWLAAQGHEVTVVTAPPYYPEWKIRADYKRKGWYKEKLEGVTIYRVPLYVPKVVTAKKRIIHEFSFLAGVFPVWLKLLFKRKFDVVININPPFHLGIFALLYAKLKRTKLLTHIQDLQIDAAKDLGMIRNQALLKGMFKAEKYILKKSDAVSSISLGMQTKILVKEVLEYKLILFPNWVDENAVRPLGVADSLRQEWNIPLEDKVILYSGNLGEKQGLEILLDAADELKGEQDVRFVIVGNGGAREMLEARANSLELSNVQFYPLQPYEKLSALLATADIHLVLQKKLAADLVMPSKLTGILAAGGCTLVTAMPETSLYEVIDQHGLGLIVEPESAKALVEGISELLAMDRTIYKQAARDYAVNYLAKDQIMKDFEAKLHGLTGHANESID